MKKFPQIMTLFISLLIGAVRVAAQELEITSSI